MNLAVHAGAGLFTHTSIAALRVGPLDVPSGRLRTKDLFSDPGAASVDGDGGACVLEGSPGLVRGLLADALKQRFGGAVDQVLGLLEPRAREGADLLDDRSLVIRLTSSVTNSAALQALAGCRGCAQWGRRRSWVRQRVDTVC
jgi:hypothetical protein